MASHCFRKFYNKYSWLAILSLLRWKIIFKFEKKAHFTINPVQSLQTLITYIPS